MKLLKSTLSVGGFTFLSRISGFARDMIIARFFGAGAATDAFFVAFRVPNLFRRLFAEGSFSLAFVPVFREYRETRTEEELKELTNNVAGCLTSVLLVVVAAGMLAAPQLVYVFAPGFADPDSRATFDLTAQMLRITFPYLLFISLTAFSGGMLNSFDRFAVPAATPILLNLSLIVAAIWLAPVLDVAITALAWGVLAAGVAQLLLQVPFLVRLGLLPRPRWGWKGSGVRRIMKLMVPTLIGSSVGQVNILVDTVIASFLVSGSVSWLYYSDRLMEFPLGVFAIALSTVILPNLSAAFANRDETRYSQTLDWALRLGVVIGLPAAVGLFMLATPILSTLFEFNEFTRFDVRMSALSLAAFAIGLPAHILTKVLAPAFYSRQNTRTPVRIAIFAMVCNMVLAGVSAWWLHTRGIIGAHAALAAASSISAFVNAGLLFWALRRQQLYRHRPGWLRLVMQVIVASLLMGLTLWLAQLELTAPAQVEGWGSMEGWQRVGWLVLLVGSGGVVYALGLFALGLRPSHLTEARP